EALSDDGSISGRGDATARGVITGGATFLGGTFHSLPFIIDRLSVALAIAIAVVSVELVVIAVLRRRFLDVTLSRSLIQVTLGGRLLRRRRARHLVDLRPLVRARDEPGLGGRVQLLLPAPAAHAHDQLVGGLAGAGGVRVHCARHQPPGLARAGRGGAGDQAGRRGPAGP